MAELPERLREAAGAHRPDRERILARVERAMAAPGPGRAPRPWERTGAPWLRVTAVAAAVAGAIGLGSLAVGAVTGETSPAGTTVSSAPTTAAMRPPEEGPGDGTSGRGTRRITKAPSHEAERFGRHGSESPHSPGRTGAPHTGEPAATATPAPSDPGPGRGDGSQPGGSAPVNGVSGTGSVDGSSNPYWTQSDVTVTTDRPLTSLAVELRVARTTGVVSTGSYDSVSGQTTASTTVEGDYLVYRWALDPGRTLAPGTYTFAGQFQHAEGDRDTSGDSYAVAGNGPGGAAAVNGSY